MTKKWFKRLIIALLPVVLLGLFATAVAFDFERTMSFADLPPQALDSLHIVINPHYGEVLKLELDAQQKAMVLEGLDELESRGIRLQDFPLPPEEKGYTIEITGSTDLYLTMAPGISQEYMLEGGWFKHNLGDTQELNRYVYRLIEDAQNK